MNKIFKFTIFSTLLMFALPAISDSNNDNDNCKNMAEFAKNLMKNRQSEVPLTRVVEIIKEQELESESEEFQMYLALEAYDEPLWSGQEHKQRAIIEYENKIYSLCLREMGIK